MSAADSQGTRPWTRALRYLAWLVTAGILAQAALAGPAAFGAPDLFELHGWIGSGVFIAAVAVALLAFPARETWLLRGAALLVVVGSVAQIGLGYAGHRGGLTAASALHVPLGVTLFGLAVGIAVVLTVPRHPASPASAQPSGQSPPR